MAEARSNLVVLAVVAILTPCCFLGMHAIASEGRGEGGIVGELIGELKREDDEAEIKELRESRPLNGEEQREAREAAEQAAFVPVASQTDEAGEAG